LGEIREGRFADTLRDEEASGYPRLREARSRARALAVEKARERLG
jgi:ketol-acid reductoisomerase